VTWVRLDEGFATHPKVFGLSDQAFRVHVQALCYCGQHLTNGFVPAGLAPVAVTKELVAHGLWSPMKDGFEVHDYLAYNPSREQVLSTRDSKRIAGAIGAASRYLSNGDSTSDSRTVAGGSYKGLGNVGLDLREKESFEVFWTAYPRKVGKRKAESAFRQALRRAAVTVIIAGAERYRDDPNRENEFTAHPTTWLNRDGWADDPLPARGRRQRTDTAVDSLAIRLAEEVKDAGKPTGSSPGGKAVRRLPR